MYSTELLDHFENPRNAGTVKAPDCSAQLENPVCGDILELSFSLEGDMSEGSKQSRRIGDIRFRAKGCVPTLACGSAITELAKGKTVAEARQLTEVDLVQKIGGLPPASTHASHLAMDTLAALLRDL